MRVTKTKAVITIDDKEYEIIKEFCKTLTEIYEDDTFADMNEIIEEISCGDLDFDDFEIKFEQAETKP